MSRARTVIGRAARARAAALLAAAGRRAAPRVHGALAWRLLGRLLPGALQRRFSPSAARDLDAVLQLSVRCDDRTAPRRFELAIARGRLSITEGAPGRTGAGGADAGTARRPRAGAELGIEDLVLLATGAAGWPALLAAGRLRLSGDPFLALRLPNLLRLPLEAVDGVDLPCAGARAQPVPWPSSELGSEPANSTLSAKGRRRRTTTQ